MHSLARSVCTDWCTEAVFIGLRWFTLCVNSVSIVLICQSSCPLLLIIFAFFSIIYHSVSFLFSFYFLKMSCLYNSCKDWFILIGTLFLTYIILCQIVSKWEVLVTVHFFLYLYPFFYCRMEKKHQDERVLLKFVKKDNFDIGILITIVECCECWCNVANKFLPI